jgi:Ca-activated chloride channel family protein
MLYEWFSNISFAWPQALALLLVIPLLIYWYLRNNQVRQPSLTITTTQFISYIRSFKTWFRHFPFVLRCAALVCIIIALARPQHKFTEQQTEGEGIDIIMCFDISGSMNEKDFLPNRLEAAKEVGLTFINERVGDRIGVVIFSRQSFTLCPLTTDKNAIISQVNSIRSGYLEEEGTAIGSGLATSVDRLKDQKTKSKIIILLTDGVDYGGMIPPDIAKEMAKLYGIKVYTIGIGSEKEIDEQVETPYGRMNNRKKLEFNEKLLQDIAKETGAQYFHATDKEALKNIYSSINQLEKTKIQVTTYDRFSEKFFPFLLAGFILLLIEVILRYTVFKRFP